MIENIRMWMSGIVVAVIITTIIEMILPNGKNQKYVKTIIGVFILFTIVSPVITVVSEKKFNYQNILKELDVNGYESKLVSALNTDSSIKDVYIMKLKDELQDILKEKGYLATNIDIDVNLEEKNEYGKINKIFLKINKINQNEIRAVNNINIDINKEDDKEENIITKEEYNEIQAYIANNYGLNKENIKLY